MNAVHRGIRRPALALSGLAVLAALVAVAAMAPAAFAADDGDPTPGNHQVALVNETDAQPMNAKSHINGTANVTTYDGSQVAFSTDAALVPWDTNETDDVYLRVDGITVLVSGKPNGETMKPGNDASFEPTVSGDGRYIAFTTLATNLAKGKDTNGHTLDVVVKDMQTSAITRVSQSTPGFQRDKNSFFPVISGNGRFVSFQTFGSFSVKDDDSKEDVYVRDVKKGTTRQVSLLPGSNRDVRGSVLNGDVSDSGRFVTFGNDQMLWVRDLVDNTTVRFWHEEISAPCQPFPIGSSGRPVLSGDGKYAAWSSCSADLPGGHDQTNIYRTSLETGEIELLVEGNGHSYLPSLSRSGAYLGFGSEASDLVEGDDEGQPDAFRLDVATGTVDRASQNADGDGGNNWSATTAAAISGDGHVVAYTTYSDNLVAGDLYDYEEVLTWRG